MSYYDKLGFWMMTLTENSKKSIIKDISKVLKEKHIDKYVFLNNTSLIHIVSKQFPDQPTILIENQYNEYNTIVTSYGFIRDTIILNLSIEEIDGKIDNRFHESVMIGIKFPMLGQIFDNMDIDTVFCDFNTAFPKINFEPIKVKIIYENRE